MCSDVAISVKNLTKTYRIFGHPGDRIKQFFSLGLKQYHKEFTALKDVSFEIKRGETVGIIGRNGSGKSTLLQLICGILKPTSGSVQVNGRISALLELGAGFNPEFTGRENVYFQGTLMGFTKAQMDERFDQIAAFSDIGEFIEQPVRTYSSGMFVRLAFSVAINVDPDILMVDEALAVGDMAFQQKCIRYLQEFRQRGTLLVVSHDTSTITSLCDRVVWMNDGYIQQLGDAKSVCNTYLRSIFNASNLGSEKIQLSSNLSASKLIDQRLNSYKNAELRNDIEVFHLNLSREMEVRNIAKIIEVQLLDNENRPYGWIVGGEVIKLRIRAKAIDRIEMPILGFTIQDRTGRSIFGDNTYISFADKPCCVAGGEVIEAVFAFAIPRLPDGQYSVCAAVAEGTQSQYIMHDWCPDSLIIKSKNSSTTGDLGLPMVAITLKAISHYESH